MIARYWHGSVPKRHEDAFNVHLLKTGVAHSQRIAGNLGAQILKREAAGMVHFVLITFWSSLDAVKEFAGERYDIAVAYPADETYELAADLFVSHFEVPYAAVKFGHE